MPTVKTNGITMHYEERGNGDPLILIMGLGADGSLWEDHVRAYESHFRCILIDNRGAGQSEKPQGPYTTKMMSADVFGLMQAIGIEKAHVSGISMGSGIAQELALNYPNMVQSLTLISSWDFCDVRTTRTFEVFKSLIQTSDPVVFNRLLQLWIFTPFWHEHHLADLLAREEAGKNYPYPMPVHAFQAQCDACISHNTHERLRSITAPTLITVGDNDIFTPLHYSQSMAEQIANAELFVMADAGHAHYWEKLKEFNEKTLDFLLKHKISQRVD